MNESTAKRVRKTVARKPPRSFIAPADFSGSPRAVEVELSRLAAKGEIARVRKGLYWKGPKTALGVTSPRPWDVGMRIAGLGGGPAGFTAASALGLTTQVPATLEIAVPGRVPKSDLAGIRFTARPTDRRSLELSPEEVALIEVLSDWPETVEADWKTLATKTRELIAKGDVRPERVTKEVAKERRPALRAGWDRLRVELVA